MLMNRIIRKVLPSKSYIDVPRHECKKGSRGKSLPCLDKSQVCEHKIIEVHFVDHKMLKWRTEKGTIIQYADFNPRGRLSIASYDDYEFLSLSLSISPTSTQGFLIGELNNLEWFLDFTKDLNNVLDGTIAVKFDPNSLKNK